MCEQRSHKPHRLLNRRLTYIDNLSKQHIGISTVGLCLIGYLDFIGPSHLIVTTLWGN